ncbi:unnamed protein product, partial [Discosporangium mesarthrocarpum]
VQSLVEDGGCVTGQGNARTRHAMGLIKEAEKEASWVQQRDKQRTQVLVTKLQAAARGWAARRRARTLILRRCRKEYNKTWGAWEYVWHHPRPTSPPGHEVQDRESSVGGRGGASRVGWVVVREWYPPMLLRGERLPTPRAAERRVRSDAKRRDSRLALARSRQQEQTEVLREREARSDLLVSLNEVVQLVKKATVSLASVSVDPEEEQVLARYGGTEPSRFAIRMLHGGVGKPGDESRARVVEETMAHWRQKNSQAVEAARAQAAAEEEERALRAAGKAWAVSPRKGKVGTGKGKLLPKPPSTNENLEIFEQSLLESSAYNDATEAMTALLLNKSTLSGLRRGTRLQAIQGAWPVTGTSPVGLAVQLWPPWLRASQRFVAIAHRGSLVAISQASPYVYWDHLAKKDQDEVLSGLLDPFLENP